MPMTLATLTVKLSSGPEGTRGTFTVRGATDDAARDFGTDPVALPPVVPPLPTQGARDAYARQLSIAVFGGPNGSTALATARENADAHQIPLNVRVTLDAAEALHRHHWELLANPREDFAPFAWGGERSSFSRYHPFSKPRRPPLPSGVVRSVALLANPPGLDGLDAIDVDAERAVIREALGSTQLSRLYGPRAGFETLKRELADGVDVLMLTCHGRLVKEVPYLYLEKDGQPDVVNAIDLANYISELQAPPRLTVMVSCDSAGAGDTLFRDDGGFLASAATALVKAGVPAVIGMQGAVAQQTGRTFVKAFFRHLLAHGQVETATAFARREFPRSDDWWVPSLLLAVEDGLLWTGGPPKPFPRWDEVLDALDLNECTAILGSEIIERLSNRALAKFIASRLRYAPGLGPKTDLARISQQYRVENSRPNLAGLLPTFYRKVQSEDGITAKDPNLPRSVSVWGKRMLADSELNPYFELATLQIALFITTNPDDLLADALEAAGKKPQVVVCPWREDNPGQLEVTAIPPPTVETPVVYKLFGELANPETAVLTEDDFFDHVIWIARHSAKTIPPSIPAHLAKTSLLFLGFHLEDWEFRVLLRGLMKMQMVHMFAGRVHVAVQLDPRDLNPDQQKDAVRALEDHFRGTDVKLEIFWGTVELFLRQLREQRDKRTSVATPSEISNDQQNH